VLMPVKVRKPPGETSVCGAHGVLLTWAYMGCGTRAHLRHAPALWATAYLAEVCVCVLTVGVAACRQRPRDPQGCVCSVTARAAVHCFRLARLGLCVLSVCCPAAGVYTVSFHVPGFPHVRPVNLTVHVVPCSQGDVTSSSGDACIPCSRGWYSLDPRNSTCDQCVPNAECPGGASILPLPGWWHSSPRSTQMHR
jgi:hypothetical protein